ncbi:uncharacterized protein LOC135349858 isoform X2 [Halichondria panicea]|uniref:uncharacterized protein LOC135349858 isoform X2 n=1 Tax=Halichondria panicea TaxID=6063 RepID=UPI00312B6B27
MYLSLPLRYYAAEGVRLYSQETWRVVTQTRGVQLVEQRIHKVALGYWGIAIIVIFLAGLAFISVIALILKKKKAKEASQNRVKNIATMRLRLVAGDVSLELLDCHRANGKVSRTYDMICCY